MLLTEIYNAISRECGSLLLHSKRMKLATEIAGIIAHQKLEAEDGELCRKEFESWARNYEYKYTLTRRSDGLYESSHTHIMWEAWQASRQPLQSQLAIAREALENFTKPYTGNPDDMSLDEAIAAAEQALKYLSLDNPAERPYPRLLSEGEKQSLLKKAEKLWQALEENNLGGLSGINRPFLILYEFKEIIEQFGERDVGLTWSMNDINRAKPMKREAVTPPQYKDLITAATLALGEMCNTVAPRQSFTDAVDKLDAAICSVIESDKS